MNFVRDEKNPAFYYAVSSIVKLVRSNNVYTAILNDGTKIDITKDAFKNLVEE